MAAQPQCCLTRFHHHLLVVYKLWLGYSIVCLKYYATCITHVSASPFALFTPIKHVRPNNKSTRRPCLCILSSPDAPSSCCRPMPISAPDPKAISFPIGIRKNSHIARKTSPTVTYALSPDRITTIGHGNNELVSASEGSNGFVATSRSVEFHRSSISSHGWLRRVKPIGQRRKRGCITAMGSPTT